MYKKQILGIDLGGTNVRLGLIEDDKIAKLISKKISSQENREFIINEIIESISILINKDVQGIGIGVPSIVDIENGIVYEVHNIPSWREVHLKEILEDHFNIPTRINNDVNCFVLGEKYFGKGKGYNNIVGLALGTGLGGGIIVDGKLYSGKNGGAGEFGLIPYKDKNYEFYCSGNFFKSVHGMLGENVLRKAKAGSQAAVDILKEFGEHIGNLINSIIYAINPEIIILGGSVSETFPYFKSEMFNTLMNRHEFKTQIDTIIIEKSELRNAAVLGAAKLFE